MMMPTSQPLLFGIGFTILASMGSVSGFLEQLAFTSSKSRNIQNILGQSLATSERVVLSECDDSNLPPSLSIISKSLVRLESGSDIRGRFVDHPRRGGVVAVAKAIRDEILPAFTPFSAHCLGYAFATMLLASPSIRGGEDDDGEEGGAVTICVGRDPRVHGVPLADAFARGVESVPGLRVVYTSLATTPSMFEFCRSSLCDGAVMVTASHLPSDRNGMKFFTKEGGLSKAQIKTMVALAQQRAAYWYDMATIPPTSGPDAVYCSETTNRMPHYEESLKEALIRGVTDDKDVDPKEVLKGLKIVLNAGHGAGGFFRNVLEDLGADVSASINCEPDGRFPEGVPNPESSDMIEKTIRVCEAANADLGVLLDTDADRCGLVAPRTKSADGMFSNYEAINRNRLIALIGVILSREAPGCTIVTCSSTSEGLAKFLEKDLGLNHVRYMKGYANVIARAKAINESNSDSIAEVAIETSGHCAMKENDFLDDGTYCAVKTISLLAREKAKDPNASLLDLIIDLKELGEVVEIRMSPVDGSLETNARLFDDAALEIESACSMYDDWTLDKDNLEGIRILVGTDGSYFMFRKSLHDPVLSLQIESEDKETAKATITDRLASLFEAEHQIHDNLDYAAIRNY